MAYKEGSGCAAKRRGLVCESRGRVVDVEGNAVADVEVLVDGVAVYMKCEWGV